MSDVWHRLTGTVKEGRLVLDDRDRLKRIAAGLDGQRFELAIRKERKNRTLPQNAKAHVLFRMIAEHTGDEEVRFKRETTLDVLGPERGLVRFEILGQKCVEVKHTADMDTQELSEIIDRLEENSRFLELTPPRDEDVEVMA